MWLRCFYGVSRVFYGFHYECSEGVLPSVKRGRNALRAGGEVPAASTPHACCDGTPEELTPRKNAEMQLHLLEKMHKYTYTC